MGYKKRKEDGPKLEKLLFAIIRRFDLNGNMKINFHEFKCAIIDIPNKKIFDQEEKEILSRIERPSKKKRAKTAKLVKSPTAKSPPYWVQSSQSYDMFN
jgi:hypothetical protein